MKKMFDNDYPSVTKILDVLRKAGLEWWFKTNTPEFIEEESKKGLLIGKQIHQIVQQHIEKEKIEFETDYPTEVENAVKSFFLFRKEYPQINLNAAEMFVTSEKHKYNGKVDCLGTEKKELILIDWKTGKCNVGTKKESDSPVIYPEHCYQATAYVKAYNEQEGVNIERARIVAVAKDKVSYSTLILLKDAMEEIFNEIFLPALKIWNYQRGENYGEQRGEQKGRNGVGRDSQTGGRHNQQSNNLPSSF